MREVAHSEYLTRCEETEAALEAIAEALELLKGLMEGGEASFVQIKKVKAAITKVTDKLTKHRNVEKHFI